MIQSSGAPRRGLRCATPPRNSDGPTKPWQIHPDAENLKTAEFRKPTPQDVRKKAVKF
jgi:hypothetical protein